MTKIQAITYMYIKVRDDVPVLFEQNCFVEARFIYKCATKTLKFNTNVA